MKQQLYTFRYLLLLFTFLAPLLTRCQQQPGAPRLKRDTSITAENAVTKLYVDSLQLENFIQLKKLDDSASARLRNFYNSRNFQFAWIAENGPTAQVAVFADLDKNYKAIYRDSMPADLKLQEQLGAMLHRDTVIRAVSPGLIQLELNLTQHFFDFVNYAYAGKLDPASLQWYIPRKKLNGAALLDSLVNGKNTSPDNWEPVNAYYKSLQQELIRWYGMQQKTPWKTITAGTTGAIGAADKGPRVKLLKQRLADYGALDAKDTSGTFGAPVTAALKKVQAQLGMPVNGIADRKLINALNVPAEQRISQMLVNLERMRWVPVSPENFILVNIPEYKLHVFEGHQEALQMGIVVGKEATKTVIFSNTLKNIVFSPYWNIPPSIVRAEVLPALQRNRNYLSAKNMEQYGTAAGLPLIRQKPGNGNSLGRVKFLFPNSYNIYLHDTPAKALFAENQRAFSHGCIRLAQPAALAAYLLRNQPEWTAARMQKAMTSTREVWVTLKQPVPVFISYFTSWVDKDGRINFRDDIYGHDKKMAAQLFSSGQP